MAKSHPMKEELFQQIKEVFTDTPAHPVLIEMEDEMGSLRSYDLVLMLIVQADQIATLWQEGIQHGN